MAKQSKKQLLSEGEIETQVATLDREIFALRNELAMNQKLEKPHLIKAKRREKARLLTSLTQQQRTRKQNRVHK
jgi:ribosomal protein L29